MPKPQAQQVIERLRLFSASYLQCPPGQESRCEREAETKKLAVEELVFRGSLARRALMQAPACCQPWHVLLAAEVIRGSDLQLQRLYEHAMMDSM